VRCAAATAKASRPPATVAGQQGGGQACACRLRVAVWLGGLRGRAPWDQESGARASARKEDLPRRRPWRTATGRRQVGASNGRPGGKVDGCLGRRRTHGMMGRDQRRRLTCSVAGGVARSSVMCGVTGVVAPATWVGERTDACTARGKERPCSHLPWPLYSLAHFTAFHESLICRGKNVFPFFLAYIYHTTSRFILGHMIHPAATTRSVVDLLSRHDKNDRCLWRGLLATVSGRKQHIIRFIDARKVIRSKVTCMSLATKLIAINLDNHITL
jgi:hypothetical protein